MPTHPPRSSPIKKVEILERREVALRRAISEGSNPDFLSKAVEDVREAQLNLFKAKLALIAYRKGFDPQTRPGAKIEKNIQAWLNLSQEEIVNSYRSKYSS